MKIRIALWAFTGVLVAAGWWLYLWFSGPAPLFGQPLLWIFAQLSCPLLLLGSHFQFSVSVYSVFLSNVIVYGFTGLLVEELRREAPRSHLLH